MTGFCQVLQLEYSMRSDGLEVLIYYVVASQSRLSITDPIRAPPTHANASFPIGRLMPFNHGCPIRMRSPWVLRDRCYIFAPLELGRMSFKNHLHVLTRSFATASGSRQVLVRIPRSTHRRPPQGGLHDPGSEITIPRIGKVRRGFGQCPYKSPSSALC